VTIDEKAEDIARLIIAERFECAKARWKQHTTGMIGRDLVTLRNQIEVIEGRLIAGFENTINSETGEL
jgi:hypothetical protein